jgi:hypothetical protein
VPPSLRRCFLALALSLAALPAAATTYVMMSDEALVEESPAIVVARVLSSQADRASSSTVTRFAVSGVLKGGALPSPLVVRVPGFRSAGESLLVPGAPRFVDGERVLLFLAPRGDGTWSLEQFLLGAFYEARRGDQRLAVRDLAGAQALGAGRGAAETPRDFARFADWIRERARGAKPHASYVSPGSFDRLRSLHDDFVLLGMGRWQEFDSSGSVAWQFHSAGWDGAGAGSSAFATARGAWNADANSSVSYTSGGATGTTGSGLNAGDGANRIIFGDPNNEIGGSFNCGSGGVLGIGGYFTSGSHTHSSQTFGSTAEADIVIQDGTACFFANNPGSDADVFTHELGHTLGLGHSPDSSAIMFASAQAPYAATLGDDDAAGICFLYGSSCPGPPVPNPPSNLSANATSSTQAQLTWNDNSGNETSFRVEMRTGANPFAEIGAVGANATGVNVSGLAPSTTYDFRVRARNGTGDSAYSNTDSATTLAGETLPAAPTLFSATTQSSTALFLQWQDNSANETSFVIQRQVGFSFVDFTSSPANTAAASLIGLTPNTSYTLRVVARNSAGDSPSNTSTASTLPAALTAPNAPSNLAATAGSSSLVNLSWTDNSTNEDSFRIEMRSEAAVFGEVATALPNANSISVGGLTPGVHYDFRVRARNAAGDSAYSNVASATTPAACGGGDPDTVCLNGGRFEVNIDWETPDAAQGVGHPESLSGDAAYFWFFVPDNIEVVVKVLDGCGVNDNFWVFATGLTNVKTTITVKDIVTGQAKTYTTNQGQAFPPLQDTSAFNTCNAGSVGAAVGGAPAPPLSLPTISAAACAPATHALCLQGGRFRVEADWRTPAGESGPATAEPLTGDSGYFWFFSDTNIELVVKVLDACSAFDRFWVFAGGLTNVEVVLRVTDTSTGQVKTYTNLLNQAYLPLQDANAFDTCP